jgi:hypothetical protein
MYVYMAENGKWGNGRRREESREVLVDVREFHGKYEGDLGFLGCLI